MVNINRFFSDVLGANLKNQRWSWGAVDPLEHRIYLRVWEDEIQRFADGEYVQIYWNEITTHGASERKEHIDALRNGAEGIGVVCRAIDPKTKEARKIASYDPARLIVLGRIIERGNRTWAKVDGHVPTAELSKPRSGQSTLGADLRSILSRARLSTTQKEALVNARLGQGAFRLQVLAGWENKCAVTGCRVPEVLRASHIKPWRDSTDEERLDASNGLPLTAHLDALFDVGLISFDEYGRLLISVRLSTREQQLLGLPGKSLRKKPLNGTLRYLQHHRDKIFRS